MQQSNRFLDFAKELIGRYNDPGAYYDEALMIYPEEEQRPEEPSGEAVTYVTNLYHTQNFNEENNLFVQNQSMLTQILEQNFYQNVYPDIIEQITQTVKEELPEAEERMIRSFGEHYLTLRQKEQTEQIQNICKQMFTEYHKNATNVRKEQNTLLWKLENIYNSSIYAVPGVNLTQREQQIIERKVKQFEREPISVEFQKILQEQKKTVELRDTEVPVRFGEITQNLTQEIFSTEAKITVNENRQVPTIMEPGYEPVRLIYEEEQPQVTEEAETKKISEQVSLSENHTDKKTEDKQLQERAKELTREILHRTESFVQSAKEASAELIKHDQIALQKSGQRKSEQEQSVQKAAEQQIYETLPTVTKITEQEAVQVLKVTVPEVVQVPKVTVSETVQIPKVTVPEVVQVPKVTVSETVQIPKVSESGYEPVRLIYEEEQPQVTEEAEAKKKPEQVSLSEKSDKKTEDSQMQEGARKLTEEILHRTESFVQSVKEVSAELIKHDQTALQKSGQGKSEQEQSGQKAAEQQISGALPTVTKITEPENIQVPKMTVPNTVQVPTVSESGYDPIRLTYEEEQPQVTEEAEAKKISEQVSLSENNADKKTEDKKFQESTQKLTEEILHRTESIVQSVKEASVETIQQDQTTLQLSGQKPSKALPTVTKITVPEIVQVPKVTENSYDPIRLTYEENQDTASSEQSKKEFLVTQARQEQKAEAAAEAQLQESAKRLTKEIISRTEFVPGAVTQAQQLNYRNQQLKLMYPEETLKVLGGKQSFQSEIALRYVLSAPGNRAGNVKLQTLGMEPAAIVYSQEEVSADKEQTVKLQKQVEEVVRELKTVEEKTVVQSRKVVEQQKQVVREVLKSQPDILDHAQSTQKLQKQIKKTVETQIDESITQIANRVYRQIEDRLKVERGRRGLF